MKKQIYKNREIVLLTKHKKDEVIQPILEKSTGCNLMVETRFDMVDMLCPKWDGVRR